MSLAEFSLNRLTQDHIHVQQSMAVGAGARTAAAGLDAEQVIKQGRRELVVQVFAVRSPDIERDNSDTLLRVRVSQVRT